MATIGIDLGTTFCCVAAFLTDKIEIIPNGVGNDMTPSVVAFKQEDDEIIVGEIAVSEGIREPRNTIFDIKKMIGKRFNDPKIQEYSKTWPFHIAELDGGVAVVVDKKNFSPKFVSTQILLYLKEHAETFLNANVKKAVVTVPAYFTEAQKSITRDACKDAGLEILQLISEPTAAAISYYCKLGKIEEERTCLIFDLGGGTLDITLVTYKDNKHIKIIKTGGNPNLGGEDFDNAIVEYCIEEFKRKHQIDLRRPQGSSTSVEKVARNLRRLKIECQKRKCFLSSGPRVVVRLKEIHGEVELVVPITRKIFEELNESRFQKCLTLVKENLEECGLRKEEIDDIVLVGGSSRIPRVQQLLTEYLGKKLTKSINPDEAVAFGAAMQAHYLVNADSKDAAAFTPVIEHPDFPIMKDKVLQLEPNFQEEWENCIKKNEELLGRLSESRAKLGDEMVTLSEDLTKFDVNRDRKIETLKKELSMERAKSLKLESSVKMLEAKVEMLLEPRKLTTNIPSGLLTFQNTEEYAVAVVLKNSTFTHFLHPNKWYRFEDTREYFRMPPEIPPFSQHGFGFTFKPCFFKWELLGLFSFQIDETRFVALYIVRDGFNSLGLAFLPPNYPVDENLYDEIWRSRVDWSKSPEKCKVYILHFISDGKKEKIEARLQIGSICAEATMTIGEKSVLNVEIKSTQN